MPVHQKTFEPNLDPLWCAWFSGWVDGEGSFVATISNRTLNISARLAIGVRDDDCDIVRDVQEILQCGRVYHTDNRDKRMEGNNYQDAIMWRCAVILDLRHIIVPIFDKYTLRSKKKRDYEIWREIVMLVSEKQHMNGNREYVLDLCRQLKDIRKYDKTVYQSSCSTVRKL